MHRLCPAQGLGRRQRRLAGMDAEAAEGDRPAPDQCAGRHHQLRHLRPWPAAARLRRRQGRRRPRRARCPRRRGGAGPRRADLHPVVRHVRDRRRQRRRIHRRHHGRRAFGLRCGDDRRPHRIGTVGPARHRPHRPQPRHHHRCALPLRARRRSRLHGAGPRSGDAARPRSVRRHAIAPRRRREHHAGTGAHRPALHRDRAPDRHPGGPRPAGRHPGKPWLCRVAGRRDRQRRQPELAAGHRRQGRSRRGSHAPRRRRHDRAAAAAFGRCRRRAHPHRAADPRPRRAPGAGRPRHGGDGELQLHRREPCSGLRRRRGGAEAGKPDLG